MARGRKAKLPTFAEQLEFVDSQIQNHQKCIEQLSAQRREIEQQKKHSEVEALYKAATESGMSIEEIIMLIQPPAALEIVG